MCREKNLEGWHLSTETKWKICGTALHKNDCKSQSTGSEWHKFESVKSHRHVVASAVREIVLWWRRFYSNMVSFALELKVPYQQFQTLLDLILCALEISPLSCIHFPAWNLTTPWYIHYLPVLHIFSIWKFSLKSNPSLCSLEFQIIFPSTAGEEYLGQKPFVIKPWFCLVAIELESFWSVFCCSILYTDFFMVSMLQLFHGSIFSIGTTEVCKCCL